jgi:transcriptional regulator with XRE-family HTH domain
MMPIGDRIRQIREREVWGQAELARAAGISVASLWQIEHGQRSPRPLTIRKIAKALEISPKELTGEHEAMEVESAGDYERSE